MASGTNVQHDPSLVLELVTKFLSIYIELSREDLLEQRLGGHIQNSSESLNVCIYRQNTSATAQK